MSRDRVQPIRERKLPERVAIDGPAASGKSTVAERLAHILGYLYFDTGVMYRAVTLAAIDCYGRVDDEQAVSSLVNELQIDVQQPTIDDGRKFDVLLNGQDITWEIRTEIIDANVSQVSTYPEVRKAMTAQQRRIAEKGKLVMVGRDIGTIVLPDAELKIFLDASPEVRAHRRFLEEIGRGEAPDYETILHSIIQRDRIDSSRKIAPLIAAEDAHIINTDHLSVEEVVNVILETYF